MNKKTTLYTQLYHLIEQFFFLNKIDSSIYSISAFLDYLLIKENIYHEDGTDVLSNEKYTLDWLNSMLSQIDHIRDIKKRTILDDIKMHAWYPYLSILNDVVTFYIQNRDELKMFTPIITSLNRPTVVLCDFELQDDYFPDWIIVVEYVCSKQKIYENDFLELFFPELYNYYNIFFAFCEISKPSGIVIHANSSIQEKILCDIGYKKQIPVVALNSELDAETDHLFYEQCINLNEFEENIQSISRLINEYIPFSYFNDIEEPRVHIGCGPYLIDKWLNVDLQPVYGATYMDAEQKYPFPDSSIQYIFSEHLFEHLSYTGGKNMLRECYRILKPKGIIRLTMPSLEFLINLYIDKENALYEKYIDWSTSLFAPEIKEDFHSSKIPSMFIVNNFMHFWGHKMIYDKETLTHLLKEHGFKNITYPKNGESSYLLLNNLESHGKSIPEWANNLESFSVEAQKT